MGRIYERFVRPALFRLDPEHAHELTVKALHLAGQKPWRDMIATLVDVPRLPTRVFGIEFPNPIGLAGGFDKNCLTPRVLPYLGFGFAEIGSITPMPQAGNPRPRIFRVPEKEGIINRYGFNSLGAGVVRHNLKTCGDVGIPIFINVGANKTSVEKGVSEAIADYLSGLAFFHEYADAIVFGISSPNTPGLRALQDKEALEELSSMGQKFLQLIATKTNVPKKPLLLKFAPDMTAEQFNDALGVAHRNADGVIIANTTIHRDFLPQDYQNIAGGLSGTTECFERMILLVKQAHWAYPGLPIVAVGGINSVERAQKALKVGASLVQIYTGMIYKGPFLARDIIRGFKENPRLCLGL